MEDPVARHFGVKAKSMRYVEDKNVLELEYGGEMAKG